MSGQGRQCDQGQPTQHTDQGRDPKERRMPAQMRRQVKAQRHACHGGHREGGHHNAHGTAAAVEGDHIGHHRLRQGRQHTTKNAGQDARHHQGRVVGRQAAGQRRKAKQAVQNQQQLLAVKFVQVGGRQQARSASGKRVGGHQQAEAGVADAKDAGELRPQRHHDHEIQDIGELDARQCEQQPQFSAT